jgi:3-hydroxyisobutyrate dehydrogenase-like beta-hydroxyacid dehydrogenase
MVGGRPEVYDRCRKVLQSFGDGIFCVGDHSSGHLVKALNNLLSVTTLVSVAEATLVAQ